MAKRKMKTSSLKNKGRLFQQWVRQKILDYFPVFLPEDVKSTSMGAGGADVTFSPFAQDVFPYQVECKSHKSMAVYNWYDQATAHGNYEPVLFIKANRRKPLAVIDAEVFLELARKEYYYED